MSPSVNFEIVSKKLNKYFETKYSLYRGNDYSYNNYLRKLEKLSRHESLDAEGFKEYLNCVKNLNDSKNKVLQNSLQMRPLKLQIKYTESLLLFQSFQN